MDYLLKPTVALLALVIAIIGVSVLPDVLPESIVVFIGMLSVCLTFCALRGSRVCGYLAVFLIGGAWSGYYALEVSEGWLSAEVQQKPLMVRGVITGIPVVNGELTRFDLLIETKAAIQLPGKVRLSWFHAPELVPGEQWQFTVKLKRPHTFASEGVFDYEVWIVRQGVQGTGYVKEAKRLKGPDWSSQWLNRFRQQLQLWVKAHTGSDVQGMLVALLTGDKSGISQAQWTLLNLTGTTHLMVISGLHIGLMAALGFWFVHCLNWLVPLPLRVVPLPFIAGLSGVLLALGYAALAGFSIPVQRALVMTLVALAGPFLGVRPAVMTVWLIALTLVVVLDPLAFTSPGFWYSFLAVAALLYGLGGRLDSGGRLKVLLKPQWVVFCVLTPMLLMAGQPVSMLSPFINLVAIPMVGLLVVPLVLLAGILSCCWPWLAEWVLMAAEQLMMLFQWGLIQLESYAVPIPVSGTHGITVLLLTLLAVFLLISPASLRLRWFAPVLLLPWIFPVQEIPEPGQAEVTVFDIGQGLAVMIRTHEHTLIYDTGDRFTDELTAADRVLIPGFRAAGIQTIDRVIISHGDRDHSGGLSTLLKHYGELDVWAGSEIDRYQGEYTPCKRGQNWEWEGVHFQILSGSEYSLSNDCSCVLKITAGNESVLLPGDISQKVEKKLLSQQSNIQADVLLAPHHGSKYSSSRTFLQTVNPEVVIFSAGFANRFGHPAQETLDRVSEIEASTYNTAQHGSVRFTLGAGNRQMSAYRQTHQRYWWQ